MAVDVITARGVVQRPVANYWIRAPLAGQVNFGASAVTYL
jgi:hypothetical protein